MGSKIEPKSFPFYFHIDLSVPYEITKKYKLEDKVNISFKNFQNEFKPPQTDLTACLNSFQQKEKLDVDNQWYCNQCKEHKQAEKQTSIYRTSTFLILHLKRFKQKTTQHRFSNDYV